jgi:hypothetical protein
MSGTAPGLNRSITMNSIVVSSVPAVDSLA